MTSTDRDLGPVFFLLNTYRFIHTTTPFQAGSIKRRLAGIVRDKTFIVKFKPSALGVVHTVIASRVEIHDEHLTFCNSEGKVAALFLLAIVQSYSELQRS
jgi:hypothetical protein